jgi:glycosyltransferase involved in cell wall biosynthesis
MTTKFSVIITTYNVPEFLIECLSSFNNFENIEILVGIDGCEKTKSIIESHKNKKNIRFFYFPENCGTFNVRNNLISEVNNDVILFFDSDDISYPNIFDRYDSRFDITYLRFHEFGGKKNNTELAKGVFFINKKVFDVMVGFENWICSADDEFQKRAVHKKLRIKKDNMISFKRRKHDKNLTVMNHTNLDSEIRKSYQDITITKLRTKNWYNPEIKNFKYYELILK